MGVFCTFTIIIQCFINGAITKSKLIRFISYKYHKLITESKKVKFLAMSFAIEKNLMYVYGTFITNFPIN